jgi:hypothetical protein
MLAGRVEPSSVKMLSSAQSSMTRRSAAERPRTVPRIWKKSMAWRNTSRRFASLHAGSSATPNQPASQSSASGGAVRAS